MVKLKVLSILLFKTQVRLVIKIKAFTGVVFEVAEFYAAVLVTIKYNKIFLSCTKDFFGQPAHYQHALISPYSH